MAYSLGYDEVKDKLENIDEFVKSIDQIYDFVMITEYLDYGLLILKKIFNLSLDDITYMTVNKNMKSSGLTKTKSEIAQEPELKKLQHDFAENFATVDTALYNHFNKTFWLKVKLYSITEKDVLEFKNHQKTIFNRCFDGTEPMNRRRLEKEFHPWIPPGSRAQIMTYVFSERGLENDFCRNLVRPELAYSSFLVKKCCSSEFLIF